mmetsp:Transcript_26500/g.40451  ORF Transcript_26500/g.40451 Transcript_26500/m.40451 type:complete len:112 (-) Transcript_26500:1772-2107(-)
MNYTGRNELDPSMSHLMTSEGGDISSSNFHDIPSHIRSGEVDSGDKPIFGINHAGKGLTNSGLKVLGKAYDMQAPQKSSFSQTTMMTTPKDHTFMSNLGSKDSLGPVNSLP